MRVLAIDTSSRILGVAAMEDGRIRRWSESSGQLRHIEETAPAIARVMAELDWAPDSVSALFVASGPGSFTGLRIGFATAKGMQIGGNVTIVGVPTLEALAATELLMAVPQGGRRGLIVPTLDARAGRVYATVFRVGNAPDPTSPHPIPELERLCDDLDITREELAGRIDHLRRPSEDLWMLDDEHDSSSTDASAVLGIAVRGWARLQRGESIADGQGPVYVRDGDVGRAGGVPRYQPPPSSSRSRDS